MPAHFLWTIKTFIHPLSINSPWYRTGRQTERYRELSNDKKETKQNANEAIKVNK